MRLTSSEIRLILSTLSKKVVVPQSESFRYEIVAQSSGYSDDPEIASLQAKLSIMLEVAKKMEER